MRYREERAKREGEEPDKMTKGALTSTRMPWKSGGSPYRSTDSTNRRMDLMCIQLLKASEKLKRHQLKQDVRVR
jgi:hypothetical protein